MNEVGPITPAHAPRSEASPSPMARIRDARRAFIAMLHEIGGTDPHGGRMASANLTLAMRHIEDAESRVERHIKGGRG